MIISLDTNIFIFGLQKIKPSCVEIIKNLDKVKDNILIPAMVEKEIIKNLNRREVNIFYKIMTKLNFPIDYENPPKKLVLQYKKSGLKKGDAVIAAFCEFRKIEYFISENRHFLRELQTDKFKILPSKEILPFFVRSKHLE